VVARAEQGVVRLDLGVLELEEGDGVGLADPEEVVPAPAEVPEA